MINAVGAGGGERPAPEGRDVLALEFDVSTVPGQFEFDTACWSSSLDRIYLIENSFPPVDHGATCIFEKGVITILDCICGAKGDLNNDSASDPLDMVYMVNYVYRMTDNFVHPDGWDCPFALGDTDCNGTIDPLDVTNLVILIYRSQDLLCDPCMYDPEPEDYQDCSSSE